MRRSLQVVTPEGLAGSLVKENQHIFNYAAADRRAEVSLSMPIRAESYKSTTLHAQFAMNLPEGFLLDKMRRRLAKFGKVDDMLLPERTGRQQIGRLQYLAEPCAWVPPASTTSLQQLIDEGSTKGLLSTSSRRISKPVSQASSRRCWCRTVRADPSMPTVRRSSIPT